MEAGVAANSASREHSGAAKNDLKCKQVAE